SLRGWRDTVCIHLGALRECSALAAVPARPEGPHPAASGNGAEIGTARDGPIVQRIGRHRISAQSREGRNEYHHEQYVQSDCIPHSSLPGITLPTTPNQPHQISSRCSSLTEGPPPATSPLPNRPLFLYGPRPSVT